MFRKTAIVLILAFGFSPAHAQNVGIEEVIVEQLQAFNDRDVPAAWEHASSFIQVKFRTPENFAYMVENVYPMVWNNSDPVFRGLREANERTYQEVLIKGPDGMSYLLEYRMFDTGDGWSVDGVSVVPAPENLS